MKSKFEIYLQVKFTHNYYERKFYSGLSVIVENSTKTILMNHGLLIKLLEDGFIILFDSYHAGSNRARKDIDQLNLNLKFSLVLKDKLFYNYTAIDIPFLAVSEKKALLILLKKNISSCSIQTENDIMTSFFLFNNDRENPGIFNDGFILHAHSYVGKNDNFSTNNLSDTLFGKIDLKINNSSKYMYYIRFQSKRTYWQYIFSSPIFTDLTNALVIDEDGMEEFHDPVIINLFGKKLVTITSKNALLLCQYSKYKFKLVHDFNAVTGKYKILKSILPVAGINQISNACAQINNSKLDYTEIFL